MFTFNRFIGFVLFFLLILSLARLYGWWPQ
jgi:hypothetical protein